MIFILLALVTALVGVSPALIAGRMTLVARLFIIYVFVAWAFYYENMPSLDYTLGGPVLLVMFVFAFIAFVFIKRTSGLNLKTALPNVLITVVGLFVLMSGCGAINTGKYSALVGDMGTQGKTMKRWSQQNQEISPTHVRIVPEEHALVIGKTALNQNADAQGNIVGSQFEMAEGHVTLQKVNNDLVYVIPLDYRNWGAYNGTKGVPGYIVVNAEDQHTTPKFINGYSMKYTPGSFFGTNLERHLYTNGYSNKVLVDYSFEIDDQMKPFWVVTVCHHTIGMFSGLVVEGVVIVNPETGEIKYYDKDKAPSWVDRVIPMEILNENIGYWGNYLNGYWNQTVFGPGSNLRKPESTVLNYGADGSCWYVTPLTSNNQNDNTMTDLVYTNSRTGVSHRYTVSGATEEAIAATVDATVKFQNLHAAAVVYENVADRLTALVPILADDHSIRGLALVDVVTKSLSWDADPTNALIKYQNSLGALGAAIGTDIATVQKMMVGKVNRIHESVTTSGSIYYLYFNSDSHIFTVPQTFHKVLITEPGDSVEIKYMESDADLVAVSYFNNLTVKVQPSKNQKEVYDRLEKQRGEERKDSTTPQHP